MPTEITIVLYKDEKVSLDDRESAYSKITSFAKTNGWEITNAVIMTSGA